MHPLCNFDCSYFVQLSEVVTHSKSTILHAKGFFFTELNILNCIYRQYQFFFDSKSKIIYSEKRNQIYHP